MGPRAEPKKTLCAGIPRSVPQITDKLSHAELYFHRRWEPKRMFRLRCLEVRGLLISRAVSANLYKVASRGAGRRTTLARTRNPTVFISHREADKSLALHIAKFIKDESGKGYIVFMSSDPKFKGVRMGKEISAELREAIANCDVFLLIYTRRDVDWSWCMWEWGVASHPRSARNRQ